MDPDLTAAQRLPYQPCHESSVKECLYLQRYYYENKLPTAEAYAYPHYQTYRHCNNTLCSGAHGYAKAYLSHPYAQGYPLRPQGKGNCHLTHRASHPKYYSPLCLDLKYYP